MIYFKLNFTRFRDKARNGFTLIESLVSVVVFLIIVMSVYQLYITVISASRLSRLKVSASALANEQLEVVRNLPYADVGIIGGIPEGKIPRMQNLVRDNVEFTVETTIRNIDDPFDGTIGGSPKDFSPADYKLVELGITCSSCAHFVKHDFATRVGPKDLESASTNGALFVQVFDATGQPVSEADVHIENNQASPAIAIDEVTDKNGLLQIVDAPPGVEAYEIIVSKPGYSTDRTYQSDELGDSVPTKPHATVALQQLTEISFVIDKTSALNVFSSTEACGPIPSVDFLLSGSKLIGIEPDFLKYSASHSTDVSGEEVISNLEWDAYDLEFTDDYYDLAGTIPSLPVILNPETVQNLKLIVALKNPSGLLVSVKDDSTRLPLSDALVSLQRADYDESAVTGRGFLHQTDWSSGLGQADFVDPAGYFDSDGNLETNDPTGEIGLKKNFDEYEPFGVLVSSTFDTGSESNFHELLWQPQDQSPAVGQDSVKLQIATNNDKAVWNFLGPDGTDGTYYDFADQNINSLHDGDRYLRYKIFLETASTTWTSVVSDVSFTFTSSCVPPGQVFFSGLGAGDYVLTVHKDGYQEFSAEINISSPWRQYEVILPP